MTSEHSDGISLGAGVGTGEGKEVGAPQLSGSKVRHRVGQQVGQSIGNGISSQSSLSMEVQLAGRTFGSVLKQVAGQLFIISLHGVGAEDGTAVGSGDGLNDGSGDGIVVGEHIGGDPSGDSLNIGWSGRHSKAQHTGQPAGVGRTSHWGATMAQFWGRVGSSYGKKHVS